MLLDLSDDIFKKVCVAMLDDLPYFGIIALVCKRFNNLITEINLVSLQEKIANAKRFLETLRKVYPSPRFGRNKKQQILLGENYFETHLRRNVQAMRPLLDDFLANPVVPPGFCAYFSGFYVLNSFGRRDGHEKIYSRRLKIGVCAKTADLKVVIQEFIHDITIPDEPTILYLPKRKVPRTMYVHRIRLAYGRQKYDEFVPKEFIQRMILDKFQVLFHDYIFSPDELFNLIKSREIMTKPIRPMEKVFR